jgi:hypothetical protein
MVKYIKKPKDVELLLNSKVKRPSWSTEEDSGAVTFYFINFILSL